jgi:hypothetical protein
MDRRVFTDMWTMVSTFARATAGRCPRAARVQRNAVPNFTAKPCTTRVVVRLPVDTNRIQVQVYREGEFLYCRRWPSRALALEEADEQKARHLREGGVLIKD